MEVEDEIELAHISKVLVQDLHEGVNEFEDDELVIIFVDDGDEVQTSVSFIDDFVFLVVDKIAHFGLPRDDYLVDLG